MTIQELKEEIESATIGDIHNIIINVQEVITTLSNLKEPYCKQLAGMIAEERSGLENYFLRFDLYKNPTASELEQFSETKNRIVRFINEALNYGIVDA